MTKLIILAALIVGVGIVIEFFKRGSSTKKQQYVSSDGYRVKRSVMNGSESAFFFELQKQLPKDYYVFPKMRIADILDIPDGHDYYRMRNKALPKHIDFLVCDKYFKPIVAVELNGGSHNNLRQQAADHMKNEMFQGSGLLLETINVGQNFSSRIEEVKKHLK